MPSSGLATSNFETGQSERLKTRIEGKNKKTRPHKLRPRQRFRFSSRQRLAVGTRLECRIENWPVAAERNQADERDEANILADHVGRAVAKRKATRSRMEGVKA